MGGWICKELLTCAGEVSGVVAAIGAGVAGADGGGQEGEGDCAGEMHFCGFGM